MNNNRWATFGICCGLFLMSMLYRASNAVIASDLSRDLSLSAEGLGLLGAVFFLVFALAQFPLGWTLDRIGAKKAMVFLNLCGAAGAVVFASAGGLNGALLGRSLLGLGMCANFIGSLKLFTRRFSPYEFATVSGLLVSIGSLGSLMATTPLVLLVDLLSWRGAFIALGVLNLCFNAALWVVVRDSAPDRPVFSSTQPRSPFTEILTLFKNRSYWTISISAGIRYGVYGSIQTLWAGPFLMVHLGFSQLAAGNLLLLMNLGFICGAPVGGFLSDRVLKSRKKAVLIGMSSLLAAVLILSHWPGNTYLVWLGLIMFAFGFFGAFGQIMFAHMKDLMPPEMAGTALSGINFFIMGGAQCLPDGPGRRAGPGWRRDRGR